MVNGSIVVFLCCSQVSGGSVDGLDSNNVVCINGGGTIMRFTTMPGAEGCCKPATSRYLLEKPELC